jgi:hypothetical protein
MEQKQGTPMTQADLLLYAATLFLALLSLLRWKLRREVTFDRVRRSLRMYAMKMLAHMPAEMASARVA